MALISKRTFILMMFLISVLSACASSASDGKIVSTFTQNGKSCIFIQDSYGDYDTGLYCKQ